VYLRVRKLRDVWRREEAANIAAYLESQEAAKVNGQATGKGLP